MSLKLLDTDNFVFNCIRCGKVRTNFLFFQVFSVDCMMMYNVLHAGACCFGPAKGAIIFTGL